jgi:hypothetical protein
MAGGSRKGSNRTLLTFQMLSFFSFSFFVLSAFLPEALVLFLLSFLQVLRRVLSCHFRSPVLLVLYGTKQYFSIKNIVALSHSVHVKLATVSRTGAIGQSACYISLVQAPGRLQAAQTTE